MKLHRLSLASLMLLASYAHAFDLGGLKASGIAAIAYDGLKRQLGVRSPTRILDPRFMIADVEDTIRKRFHIDTLPFDTSTLGFLSRPDHDWVPRRLFDGTDVLFPPETRIAETENGEWVLCNPDGSTTSFRMPKDGYYFDDLSFNRGDGMDVVNGGIGTDNTITLGKGISYADIALSKVNNDLIIEVGSGEQLTLANWYGTAANFKSVLNLQVMADAMAGFDAASTDPLLNQAVQNFDFIAIANAFDQARGTSAIFMHWSATNSLLASQLAGSDTAALGGDLAHQYGANGDFTGMNLAAVQNVLNGPQFGEQAQALRSL